MGAAAIEQVKMTAFPGFGAQLFAQELDASLAIACVKPDHHTKVVQGGGTMALEIFGRQPGQSFISAYGATVFIFCEARQ
jgi:threonine dehydratase